MRRFLLAVLLLVVILVPAVCMASGYVVILKNKKKIRCKEAMQIKGQSAILTLSTGTLASYPLALVDLVETERYNQLGFGDAILIEELSVDGNSMPTPTPVQPLGNLATLDAGEELLGSAADPTPTPTPGIMLQSYLYRDDRIVQAFAKIFDESKLYVYKTSGGTQSDYFFVQAVTDEEREVFATLRTVAEAFAYISQQHPDIAPAAVELEMISTSGKPAGTFRITPQMARDLARGAVSIEQFYVANVIF